MTHHYSHVDESDKRTALGRAFEVVMGGQGVIDGVTTEATRDMAPTPKTKNPAVRGACVGGATQI